MAFINHLITGGGHIVIKRISVGMNVLNASLVEPSSCFQGDFTRRGFGLGEKEMTKPKRLRGGDATWTMDQLFCHVLRQCKLCHLEPFISRYLLSNPQYAGHNQTSWNSRKKQTSWVLGCLLLRLLRLQHQVHLFFCPGSAAGAAALKYIYIYHSTSSKDWSVTNSGHAGQKTSFGNLFKRLRIGQLFLFVSGWRYQANTMKSTQSWIHRCPGAASFNGGALQLMQQSKSVYSW